MTKSLQVQVKKEHYYNEYDDLDRWISYWHQISNVKKFNPEKVLEIGPGNKTVTRYLKKHDIKVQTVDIDSALNPDVICDVRNLSNKLEEKSFDLILCSEVLEHIPWNDFETSLQEIAKISKEYVVISLPHRSFNFKISGKLLPFIEEKNLMLSLPIFRIKEYEFDGEHYWEVGYKGHSLKKIIQKMSKHFEIIETYRPYQNPYHRFFILKTY